MLTLSILEVKSPGHRRHIYYRTVVVGFHRRNGRCRSFCHRSSVPGKNGRQSLPVIIIGIASTVSRPPWPFAMLMPGNGGRNVFPLMAHPRTPAHLNVLASTLAADTARVHHVLMQDAHHTVSPAPPASLHYVAHEQAEEPKRLSCGGSCQRVHDGHHAHSGSVPPAPPPRDCQALPSADAPLLSTVQAVQD